MNIVEMYYTPDQTFRAQLSAAPLKLRMQAGQSGQGSAFRAQLSAAPLKRLAEVVTRHDGGGLPRSIERGPVEAPMLDNV